MEGKVISVGSQGGEFKSKMRQFRSHQEKKEHRGTKKKKNSKKDNPVNDQSIAGEKATEVLVRTKNHKKKKFQKTRRKDAGEFTHIQAGKGVEDMIQKKRKTAEKPQNFLGKKKPRKGRR